MNLDAGEVYDFIPGLAIRRGIYLGKLISKAKQYRHVIVAKSYRGNFPVIYRFNSFEFKEGILESLVFVRSKIAPLEKDYLIGLLKKRNLW